MHTVTRPALLLLLAALACVACAQGGREAPPTPFERLPQVDLTLGETRIRARVVTTFADRRRGLGGVRHLGADEGMLFVYPDLDRRQFWMRGCLIALDIAFLGADGSVLLLETLPPPSGETGRAASTRSSPPSAFVLEVEAGFFERNGLGVGTVVHIPAVVERRTAE